MALDLPSYLLGKSKGGGGGSTLITKNITQNGTYNASDDSADGYSKVNVNVPAPAINLQNKQVTITTNTTTTIQKDSGYDGLGTVEVTTNIPQPSGNINITDTNVTDVTNYATAQVVDSDLVAGNIKKDVNILGVVGTYEGSGGDLSEYFENSMSPIATSGAIQDSGWYNAIKTFPELAITGISGANLMVGFPGELPFLDTSSLTTFKYFAYTSKTTSIPLYNTSLVTDFSFAFSSCENLVNVPILNTSKVTRAGNFNAMFANCNNLSSASLNNILKMCINSNVAASVNKTLKYLFVFEMSQYYPASMIESLSNYQDFIDAGWTIGW